MKHALVFLSLALLGIELCYGTPARKDFVTRRGEPVYIECDTAKVEPVVKTALEMLAHDCAAVLDAELHISPTLDSSAKQGSFIVMTSQALEGWEHFCLQSRAGKLFLGASDAHGMAYGLLEISRLLGVSPWEWWADVTPRKRDELRIAEGMTIYETPDVPFRGIFINDEDWGLMPWSSQNYEPTEVAGQIRVNAERTPSLPYKRNQGGVYSGQTHLSLRCTHRTVGCHRPRRLFFGTASTPYPLAPPRQQ